MSADPQSGIGALATAVVRRRRWVAGAWVLVALLLLPHAREAKARLAVGREWPAAN